MRNLIILLGFSVLIGCGVVCSQTDTLYVSYSNKSYTRWRCNDATTLEIEYGDSRRLFIMVHELMHAYSEVAPHHNGDWTICFFGRYSNQRLDWWRNQADIPPCVEDLQIMDRGRGRHINVYSLENEWEFNRDLEWATDYWNYWLGYPAFILRN